MKLKPKRSVANILEPRPVHPRAVREHGLFGKVFVKQHMFIDDLWTPKELKCQFERMAKLLELRLRFSRPDNIAKRKRMILQSHNLRRQCQEGRAQLKISTAGDPSNVRNLLQNHKQMQRLYQQLPTYIVENKINQRTFVMRREQDRLTFQMSDLKKRYCDRLAVLNDIQNRIQFENEFILDEEIRCEDMGKQIQSANTRLKAVKAINDTYRKILHVLRQDAIFYESILRSLDNDVQNQSDFIRHILYLGSPAIKHFKELSEQYRKKEETSRNVIRSSIKECTMFFEEHQSNTRKSLRDRRSKLSQSHERRYERETRSMLDLKSNLEEVEESIKKFKDTTLTCNAEDVFDRVKTQNAMTQQLNKVIETSGVIYDIMETKEKYSSVFKDVVTHGYDASGVKHANRVKELEMAVKKEDEFQESTLAHIKNRSDVFVLIRFALWNINEIMHYVDPRRLLRREYPTAELKLPLLNFEYYNVTSVPPGAYPEYIETLVASATKKLKLLMNYIKNKLLPNDETAKLREQYCKEQIGHTTDSKDQVCYALGEQQHIEEEIEDAAEIKSHLTVPDRKAIKAESSRVIDEVLKKAL